MGWCGFWKGWCGNPSGSRPNFFGRQHLTFDKGGKCDSDFRGIIVFLQLLWEWQYSVQREEQARQGCLSVCAQVLCKDAKPTKHTQTLILRKARGIVRFWEGWVRNEGLLTEVSEKRKGYGKCGNLSGSRPNFFGDSTSPLTREASVMVWGKGWCGDLSVDDALHCNRKNRVLYRTRLILTVDILFWRYPLSVLLYCKVKMRCQL